MQEGCLQVSPTTDCVDTVPDRVAAPRPLLLKMADAAEGFERVVAKLLAAVVSPSRKVTELSTLTEPAVMRVMATFTLEVGGSEFRMALMNCTQKEDPCFAPAMNVDAQFAQAQWTGLGQWGTECPLAWSAICAGPV